MSSQSRIGSIDIVKGMILISIIFLNILYLNYLPIYPDSQWTPAIAAKLAGALFPGIIFLIGITIPFSITKRINEGLPTIDIARNIFSRSIILITVGVLIFNTTRVEAELTGLNKNLWAILLFTAFFLVWNRYPEKENNFFTNTFLRLAGLSVFVFLVFRFKSGSFENNGSLIPGWWELPGLAGWAYLVAGLSYLLLRNSLAGTLAVWALFMALNILSWLKLDAFLDPVRPYFGVLTDGNIPAVILTGQLTGLLLKRYPHNELMKPVLAILISGVVMTASGLFIYLNFFPGSITGNPAWVLLSCGISSLVFILLFWLDEVLKLNNPAVAIIPLGANFFTVYILQYLLLNIAAVTGTDIFFFLKPGATILNIAGAAVWTLLVCGVAGLLIRFNIRLKF